MPITPEEQVHISSLKKHVRLATKRGVTRLGQEALDELPALYRFASSLLARLEASGVEAGKQRELRTVLGQAHSVLYGRLEARSGNLLTRTARLLFDEAPRTIRSEWKILTASFILFYGFAIVSYFAVANDLELAYTLFDPAAIDNEIQQLESTAEGEPFVGNFSFGLGKSPGAAGQIMAHNMFVSVLFFASGLIPPFFLLLLSVNGLMVGTYTAVAGHWGQAGSISSILWCHGTIELQAIVLAGAAGLVLVRAWIAHGAWSRSHAMSLESKRAWRMLAPVFPMLFFSGIIEGFVSPHAPFAVRIATAIVTGICLILWVALGGRRAVGDLRELGAPAAA